MSKEIRYRLIAFKWYSITRCQDTKNIWVANVGTYLGPENSRKLWEASLLVELIRKCKCARLTQCYFPLWSRIPKGTEHGVFFFFSNCFYFLVGLHHRRLFGFFWGLWRSSDSSWSISCSCCLHWLCRLAIFTGTSKPAGTNQSKFPTCSGQQRPWML